MRAGSGLLAVLIAAVAAWGIADWHERQTYYAVFPRLKHLEQYEPPETNCIAWSVGEVGWLWADGGSLEDFDRFNAKYGFHRLPNLDWSYQPGTQKLLTYGTNNHDGELVVTHQARQMPDGSWTSKLGKTYLIKHQPEELNSVRYGQPIAVYAR